ncbi:MAG: ANL family adenylate-forming protein [Pseudobdellovibrio sp.]
MIFVSLDGEISFENQPAQALHPAVAEELKSGHSVFVVRTSGSSGLKPKFVLHNAGLFFSKYQKIGAHFQKTFAFSPLESIAGIETLLECFTHGRTLVGGAAKYNPQVILELLSNCKVDYFQTTPSFLNLLFLSGNIKDSDLSHLKKIAYGSEPTPPSLAERLHKTFPQTELCQTYGMTEIGIQKTLTPQAAAFKFKPDDLLNPIKIVDGILLVNSLTPLVGYLNYPNDFDRIWFNTGDRSSCDEDHYIQVLGREGDLINVAGRKFFPSEVEEVLLRHPDIQDVSVFAEKNPILGTAITVKVFPLAGVDERAFKASFKSFCETHLPQYMHPHRVLLLSDPLVNARFKKVRKA